MGSCLRLVTVDNMRHLEFICLFLGTLLLLGCEGSSSCNGCNCPQIIRLNPAKDSNTTVITSPSFPSKYPKNQNCKWTINATKGKLRLTFDKFKMEWAQNCLSSQNPGQWCSNSNPTTSWEKLVSKPQLSHRAEGSKGKLISRKLKSFPRTVK